MKKSSLLLALSLSFGAMGLSHVTLAADVANGEKVFNKCKACHELAAGKNKVGPSLHGIIGRKAGSIEGFKYSDGMKNSGVTWDEASITSYMKAPKDFVKGNRMAFAGLKKDEEIADLIAFLKEKTK